jgi:hypothetical protein
MLKKFCNWVKKLLNWRKPKQANTSPNQFYDDELLAMLDQNTEKLYNMPPKPSKMEGTTVEWRRYTPIPIETNKAEEENKDA